MVVFLHRDRVMEARFDRCIIQLPNRARAIDGVMFRREAWDTLSGLEKETSCRLCHRAGDPPGGGGRPEFPSPGAVRAGHSLKLQRRSLCSLMKTTAIRLLSSRGGKRLSFRFLK